MSFQRLVLSLLFLLAVTPSSFAITPKCIDHLYPHSHELHTPTGFIKVKDHGPQILWTGDLNAPKPEEIKIMSYNVENLITHAGYYAGEDRTGPFVGDARPKSPEKIKGTAKIILENKPHVIVVPEVFRVSDAKDFCEQYLNGEYEPLLIEGNDGRGIDVAMLIRKDMPYEVHYHSNKDVTGSYLGRTEKVFSRDMPVAYFVDPKTQKVDFAVVGVHNKSKRGNKEPGDPGPDPDPESNIKRGLQASVIAAKTKEIKEVYPDTPVFVVGDYNNDVPSAAEFAPLKEGGLLTDAFDALGVPRDQRLTHSFHPRGGAAVYSQLDAILSTMPGLVKNIHVIPYVDEHGSELRLPLTYEERETRPSDHRAIMATFGLN